MNTRFFIATGLLAAGISSVALAEPTLSDRLKEEVHQAARAVETSVKDMKHELFSNPTQTNQRYSASGMIGRDVKNNRGETVARVKDIIISPEGRAVLMVVSDGGTMGLGARDVAFEYASLVNPHEQGEVLLPLSETILAKGTVYSPDANEQGYSVSALLKGKLEDPAGKNVADIESITFENGQAQAVIVAFDKILGMGGKQAAVSFNDLHIMRKGQDKFSARLNNKQSAAYEAFKDNAR